MKKINFLFVAFALLILNSCNENLAYDDTQSDFPENRWAKDKIIEFTPSIDDADSKFDIYLDFRHVHGFQLNKFKIKVTITSPSGKVSDSKYTLKVKDRKGEYKSECAGDYCDLRELLEKKYKFKESGEYKIEVEQLSDLDPLPNVMSVGLAIEKHVKQKKDK